VAQVLNRISATETVAAWAKAKPPLLNYSVIA
jgi:hypothetical protein